MANLKAAYFGEVSWSKLSTDERRVVALMSIAWVDYSQPLVKPDNRSVIRMQYYLAKLQQLPFKNLQHWLAFAQKEYWESGMAKYMYANIMNQAALMHADVTIFNATKTATVPLTDVFRAVMVCVSFDKYIKLDGIAKFLEFYEACGNPLPMWDFEALEIDRKTYFDLHEQTFLLEMGKMTAEQLKANDEYRFKLGMCKYAVFLRDPVYGSTL